jgi:adenosylmethionine-8-amino-7-oxononanoate aminotransferase
MSAKELAEATKRMFLPFMQMKDFAADPLILAEGDGIYVTDVDGNRFIDGVSGIFACNVGYRNERVIEAMKTQLDKLHFHLLMHSTNEPAIELAALLDEITPPQFTTSHLVSGGSEATETAMKIARQYHRQTGSPGRYKIISRYWSYHGGTLGSLAASGGAVRKAVYEPFPTGYVHIPPPFCYRCPFNLEYGDCGINCAELLDEVIQGEGASTVAAFIAEPIIVAGDGFVVPPPEYFKIVREICDRHGVLMIADEVITGFGRTGKMFASEVFDVWPDILAMGKGMSGGYFPVAAAVITDQIAQAFWGESDEMVQFHAGHTYGGAPLAGAAAVATIHELLDRDLPANAAKVGGRMKQKLTKLAEKHDVIGQVTGEGLLLGIEYVQDRATHQPFPDEIAFAKRVDAGCRKRGLITRPSLHVQMLGPPLILTEQQADEIVDTIDAAIAEATAGLTGTGQERPSAAATVGRRDG